MEEYSFNGVITEENQDNWYPFVCGPLYILWLLKLDSKILRYEKFL